MILSAVTPRRCSLAALLAVATMLAGVPVLDDAQAAHFGRSGGGHGHASRSGSHSGHSSYTRRSSHTKRTNHYSTSNRRYKNTTTSRRTRTDRDNYGHYNHKPKGTGNRRVVTTTPRPTGEGTYPRWPRHPHHPHHPSRPYLPPVIVNNPPSGGVIVDNGGGGGPPRNVLSNAPSGGGGGGGGPTGGQVTRRNGSGVPPANENRYVPDEVVLELAPGITEQAAQVIAARYQLVRIEAYTSQLGGTTVVRWRIPDGRSVPTVVQALEADGTVISAQPNYLFRLTQDRASEAPPEGDPAQYALAKLHLTQAHALARGTKVKVAVIDSGVDVSNPELAGDIAGSLDPIQKGEKVHKHGTGVAGVIAAHGRLMGAAPSAQLLVVRAFGDAAGDDGTTFAIVKGLDWAASQGARIVNMSFTGPQDPEIARNIARAYENGIVLIAAMGNEGPNSPTLYPAADPHVIAVTATDPDNALPEFASRGKHVAVAAPGVDLMMIAPHGQMQFSSGTSFSAPYVTGTVALMIERKPDLSPAEVKKILMGTAEDLGPKGFDPGFGAGLVDAYKALRSLSPATVGTASR